MAEYHVHVHFVESRQGEMLDLLRRIEQKVTKEMASLQDIQDAVTQQTTVQGSVVTLLGILAADLKAAIANNNPTQLQAVLDTLNSNAQALAAAVVANTPAAPGGGGTPSVPATA